MESVQKPVFLLLIVFIIFLNLTTFSDSRATITFADLTPVKGVEHPHGVAGTQGTEGGKDDQGALLLNELQQDSYGAPSGYGYGNPYPGGIFGFPRGLFGFPRGFFGPRGIFGLPGGIFGIPPGFFGFPGFPGGNPGVYGVNPGGYGGYPGGSGGGQPGDKPGGGGGYGGKVEVKGK